VDVAVAAVPMLRMMRVTPVCSVGVVPERVAEWNGRRVLVANQVQRYVH
jgi:hypothetical protein